jgi:tetratricopeptide (TPR) repeat protein
MVMVALALFGRAEERGGQSLTFWRDPAFQKAFMGSYGVRADVEPRVTVVERELMEKAMRLMAEEGGGGKAAALLEKNNKPTASAVFDFTLANLHFQEERLTNAAACYLAAIEKHPEFQRAHKNLALIRIRQGDFEAALEPLTRSIELGAHDGLTYGLLGYAYSMTEQYASSESAYRLAMMFQPNAQDWRLGLCRALFKQQKFGEAVVLCDELLRREPSKADFLLLQANAYLGLKQPMRAAEIYELLDLSGRAPVAALHTLGDIYASDGYAEQAADAYLRAWTRDVQPDMGRQLRNVEVLVSRAALEGAERLLKAVVSRAGAEMPADLRKRALKLEARLTAAKGACGEEQVRVLEEIVKLDPLDGDALILLGQHHAPRDAEKAIFYFERAEGIDAFEADAKLRHAQLLVKGGRYQEALPLLKRALELKPREDVQRYAEQVERAARRNG